LNSLRDEITRILGSFDIRVLSEDGIGARIPGLKPNPSLNFERRKNATVGEALFFQALG
jgi:hypothetical protein